MIVSRIGPDAPVVDAEPTSSWSNRAIIATWSAGSAAARAVVAAQHDTWLSRRPLASSERSAPSTAAGWTSNRHSSHAAGTAVPARSAIHCANVGRRASVAHTGLMWAWRSRTRPRSLTSRSRWIASCGTRAIGSSTATSVVVPSGATRRPAMPRSRSSQLLSSTPP